MKNFYLSFGFIVAALFSFAQVNPIYQNSKRSFDGSQVNSANASVSGAVNAAQQSAQQNSQHTCKTFELNQQHYLERGLQNEFNQDYMWHAQNVNSLPIVKTAGVNEISIIFHVVHATGDAIGTGTNVSNADIMQVYNDLVEDFLLLNANAANARTGAPFNFTPANPNINFCLATQDENGTPLTEVGVIRVPTNEDWYDSDNGEENKMKSAATGGSEIWNRNNYLNVWICDISNGAGSGTAGYAYRPTPSYLPSANIDGIVLDYNLGVNNFNVLTHEVGHYLGLDHTWGGSGGCGNDDGFSDTPATDGPSFNYLGSCSGSQQTCSGIETQYENYMDYANCTVMFTQEQADYMLVILQGIRSSLLLSPGCDPVAAPPSVDFVADQTVIPVGGTVNFTSLTTNAPTSWTWDFGGGATNVTTEDASATFNNVGFYTITHTATNAYGTGGPEVKTNYIEVVANATGIACDTLRNYDPLNDFYNVYWQAPATGYACGNATFDGTATVPAWAEFYQASSATTVRALEFVPNVISDGGGSVTFNVYDNNAGAPGNIVASETVLLADLTESAWNNIPFTTPQATPLVQFWVGYEMSYNSTDTFALLVDIAPPSGINEVWVDYPAFGWTDQYTSSTFAGIIDVLTSNGPAPTASATYSDTEICVGGEIMVNGVGSSNTGEYLWLNTDVAFTQLYGASSQSGVLFNDFPVAGDELLTLYAYGSCLRDITDQVITIHPAPNATITGSNTTCGQNNGVITITGAQDGIGAAYEYSIDGGVNYVSFTGASTTINNLPAGSYDVILRSSGSGCSDTTTNIVVGVSSDISPVVSANQFVCNGETVTITASGGTSYSWSDGNTVIGTTTSLQVSPSVTTQYSCVVSDGSGCSSIVFTTVGVDNGPVLTNTFNDPNQCQTTTGDITVIGVGTGDITWTGPVSNSATNQPLPYTITGLSAGVYDIQYSDASGGCSYMQVTLTDPNAPATPTITAGGPLTFCQGQTVTLTSSYTGAGNNWSPNNETTNAITVGQSGTYTVTYTDGSGCSATSAPIVVSVTAGPNAPTITASGPTTICDGDDVQLTSSYSTGILWSTNETTPTITVSTGQSVTVTYTNGSGCSTQSAPTVITVNPAPATPTITAGGPTTFCDGNDVTLTASQATGVQWSNNAITQDITVNASGSYTVTYTDGNGCSATSAATVVTVNPAPTVTLSPLTQVCVYNAAFALSGGSPAGGTYSGTGVTSNQFDPNSAGLGTHSITYSYTDGNGCSNDASQNIVVDACLGLEEITTDINVYPNPANDHLIIELNGEFNYSITDARGRLVMEGAGNNKTTVDVQSFEYGVYFVNIHADDKLSTVRIVKQ